jgi:hypothetical protein
MPKRIMDGLLGWARRSPHDVDDDGVHAGVSGRVVGDHRPLTQNDDPVADREDVGQAMVDEDDGDALALESSGSMTIDGFAIGFPPEARL